MLSEKKRQEEEETVPPFSLKFDPQNIREYQEEGRQVDCTTVARAAEAGELEFLKWCNEAGYSAYFDATAFAYAVKANQVDVAQWMLSEEIIHWQYWFAPYDWCKLRFDARKLGLSEELVARIPRSRFWQ